MSATLVNVLNESNSRVFIGAECANTIKSPPLSSLIIVESGATKTIETVGNVSSSNLYIYDSDKRLIWRGTVPTGILLTYDGTNLYHNKTLIPDLLIPLDEMDNTTFSPFGRYSIKTWILLLVLLIVVFLFLRYYYTA